MRFEWNEAKRLSNIDKHGLDFADADILFAGPHLTAAGRVVPGENRKLAVGLIDDIYVTAVYTVRRDTIRIISLRRARSGERSQYQEVFSR